MKILCKIKRSGGSHIEMPKDFTVYHFAPNEHGDHVADVSNKEHIKILLGIDAYEPYDGPAPAAAPAKAAEDETETETETTGGQEPAADQPTDEVAIRAALANLTLEELQAEYHHIYGRAAHPQSKHATLLDKVVAGKLAVATKG